jgi:hypothetical protein
LAGKILENDKEEAELVGNQRKQMKSAYPTK